MEVCNARVTHDGLAESALTFINPPAKYAPAVDIRRTIPVRTPRRKFFTFALLLPWWEIGKRESLL